MHQLYKFSDHTQRSGYLKSELIFDMHFASIDVRRIWNFDETGPKFGAIFTNHSRPNEADHGMT